jgi:hypothetical protein
MCCNDELIFFEAFRCLLPEIPRKLRAVGGASQHHMRVRKVTEITSSEKEATSFKKDLEPIVRREPVA